ncbi:MAG: Mov34/MPN/PAD-1 family protein [Planctomycetes bacterium]|nr:Mov34/MPN/PAD-1 family protein [Planctomycetota bacterium]
MNLRIRVKGARGPDPVERPPPGEREGTRVLERGRRPPPGLTVYVERRPLESMLRRAGVAGDYEVGGFLLGASCRHDGRRFVEITAQVPAVKAESARAHLTFGVEAVREFHETHAERYPGTTVLGWWHTHPGYGLFLSSDDMFIHTSFYAAEHHVAIVIDPRAGPREEIGVFVWEEPGEVSPRPRSLVVYEDERPRRAPRRER